MDGMEVASNDDHKLGTVVAERDDCAIIQTGHVFKAKHAVPRQFLREQDGAVRATLSKDVIESSPKVDDDELDTAAVREYYGLDGTFEVDPDPDGLDSAETVGERHGVEPAPEQRLGTLGGENDPSASKPAAFDRMASAVDPGGVTANLSNRNRTNRTKP
jgi:hypothetical protein